MWALTITLTISTGVNRIMFREHFPQFLLLHQCSISLSSFGLSPPPVMEGPIRCHLHLFVSVICLVLTTPTNAHIFGVKEGDYEVRKLTKPLFLFLSGVY